MNTNNINRYPFKKGLLNQFEVLDIQTMYDAHRHLLTKPHRLDFHQILWCKSGSGAHMLDFRKIPIKDNTLMFTRSGRVQAFDLAENFSGFVILFTDAFFCRSQEDRTIFDALVLFNSLIDDPVLYIDENKITLERIFTDIIAELHSSFDQFQSLILYHLLHTFLFVSDRLKLQKGRELQNAPTADLQLVMRLRNAVEQEFMVYHTVSRYVDRLGVSEKQLTRAAQRVLGITPKQIIDQRVMLEAKRLLAYSQNAVKQIAFDIGFDEPTNFTKFFRKHEGCTPMQFRVMILSR